MYIQGIHTDVRFQRQSGKMKHMCPHELRSRGRGLGPTGKDRDSQEDGKE